MIELEFFVKQYAAFEDGTISLRVGNLPQFAGLERQAKLRLKAYSGESQEAWAAKKSTCHRLYFSSLSRRMRRERRSHSERTCERIWAKGTGLHFGSVGYWIVVTEMNSNTAFGEF